MQFIVLLYFVYKITKINFFNYKNERPKRYYLFQNLPYIQYTNTILLVFLQHKFYAKYKICWAINKKNTENEKILCIVH